LGADTFNIQTTIQQRSTRHFRPDVVDPRTRVHDADESNPLEGAVDYDEDKVDEMVLALLHLTAFKDGPVARAWKGFDWDAMDRLYEKGMISDPKSKAKSVVLTEDGERLARELFERHFGLET
jgi:hypothetical protein